MQGRDIRCRRHERGAGGTAYGLEVDALGRDQARRMSVRIGEQAEQEVGDGDPVVASSSGLLLGRHHGRTRLLGELAEALAGIGGGCGFGREPLLYGLLAHPHAAADVGPGRPGAARLVDEVADQMVGHLAEMGAQHDGLLESFQGILVGAGYSGDEVVESDNSGISHASTLG